MKVSAKLFLYTRRLKTNSQKFPLKIKVSFQREKKFYGTGIDLTLQEYNHLHTDLRLKKTFKLANFYLDKAEKIIEELRSGFSFLNFEKAFFNANQNGFKKRDFDVNAKLLFYRDQLIQEGRIRTGKSFEFSSNWLQKFTNKKTISFSEITSDFLKAFDKYMRRKSLSPSTISIYIRNIRTIFNVAIKDKLVSRDDYPFGRNLYSPPAARNIKKALSISEIEKIFNYKPIDKQEQWAKDMWFFSYFCSGINFKDIALLKFKDIKEDEIIIDREKTINTKRKGFLKLNIILTEEAKDIIRRWSNRNTNPHNYVFPVLEILDDEPLTVYSKVNTEIKKLNKYLKRIAERVELSIPLSTNSARHSYSTVLKRAGISIEMISENLGHSSLRTTQIYLDSFEKEQRKETVKHLLAFKKGNE